MKKRRILVVDDDQSTKDLLRILLEEDFDLLFAFNGQKAIELITKESAIDIILMDGNMPIMDGWEATIEIKKICSTIPIVCISSEPIAKECLGLFVIHFQKPFNVHSLVDYLLTMAI